MIVSTFPLEEAVGCILVHSVHAGNKTLRKGHKLTDDDAAMLAKNNVKTVFAAKLEIDDVHEDDAAHEIANALFGGAAEIRAVGTGRCNVYAVKPGVLTLDVQAIHTVNRIHEGITVATLFEDEIVSRNQMVATVKIIPYSIPKAALEAAREELSRNAPAVAVAPFSEKRVTMISTRVEQIKSTVIEKTVEVTKRRISAMGGVLSAHVETDHSAPAVAQSLQENLADSPDLILVSGGSAIADRHDVIPQAIRQCGGEIVHYGMPVDPGNLLLLAQIGGVPVVGLPGCARSPKPNGADWVLARLHADLPVVPEAIQARGVGGLLKEIPIRPSPREAGARTERKHPDLTAVLLAAGQSRRMGARNKLLESVDGKPMVRRVAECLTKAQVDPIICVVGHEQERVQKALEGLDITFVHNPDYAEGLSTSLRTGLVALPGNVDGVLVCLGDMPFVTPDHVAKLVDAFDPEAGAKICVPTAGGKRGNPVLWAAEFIAEMREAAGDTGAKHLIGQYGDVVRDVPMDDDAVLADIDTPEALEKLTP